MIQLKRRGLKRWFKVGAGWCLLVVGVVGLFLPVLQGLLCIASGLTLLSTEYRWAGVCLDRVKRTIRRRREEKSARPQPGTPAQLSAGRAIAEDPPGGQP